MVPTAVYNVVGGCRPANADPAPASYIAELRRGKVGINCAWHESALVQLAELEVEVLCVVNEKARAFWKVWVDLRESELEVRDRE